MRDSRGVELFEGATVLLTMPCSRSNESVRCFCGTVIKIHESTGRVTVEISAAVRATVPATSVTIAEPTVLAPWNEAVAVTRVLLSEHCAPSSALESVAWAKKHLDALSEGGE